MQVTRGLVQGRGVMNEKQRSKWLLFLPASATFNESMQELTNQTFTTSEQHKELASARVKQDNKGGAIVLDFLIENNPFEHSADLRSIVIGITADSSANVNRTKAVGEKILEKLYGKNVLDYSFSKKDTAVLLGHAQQLNIDGERVNIDPQQLFQRLLATGIAQADESDVDQLLQFELSPHPTSLFDEYGMM
ncbi:uncharacterized protein LOC143026863 [Oratosquilla oratoria]|uniref:uncharacterized protein LOC143026863 n=1 Tax=Oratosquilla oratoria TaxID=337810 RepID=UPI003F75BE29